MLPSQNAEVTNLRFGIQKFYNNASDIPENITNLSIYCRYKVASQFQQ